jgi:RimJ/RimL family protein N-acetyltransferase
LTGTCSPTARLRYRRPAPGDAESIFAYASDPAVAPYIGFPRHRTLDDTRAFISWSDGQWSTTPSGPFLIERRDTGRVIGSVGLKFDTAHTASAGYVLAQDAWGHGFATEALGAILALADTLAVRHVWATAHRDNLASHRVLEKQGFRLNHRNIAASFPNLPPVPQVSYRFVRPSSIDVAPIGGRADVETCAAMMAASEPWITLKRTRDALIPVVGDRSKQVFVTRDAHGIAAFVILDRRGLLDGYVQTLAVRPDARGQGLGAALLTWAELQIQQTSPNVFLCVSSFNTRAQAFYERLGYERVGVLHDLIVEGADEILLRKSIRAVR